MLDDGVRIEALHLTVRTYNCLKRGRINTVRQLLSLRKDELLGLRNLRREDYHEIREALIAHQLLDPSQSMGPFSNDEDEQGLT
jgi:DNA-directed RNA polymerase subunit alpha